MMLVPASRRPIVLETTDASEQVMTLKETAESQTALQAMDDAEVPYLPPEVLRMNAKVLVASRLKHV